MADPKRIIPPLFTARMAEVNSGLASRLTEALACTDPVVAVRHNPRKGHGPHLGADTVAWCPMGEYLPERPQFTFDPALHQGCYYVQDASSMFIGYILAQLTSSTPVRYLDACAAPGGKTTAAIDALPWGSHIVANEFMPQRAAILRENVAKWGCPFVTVTKGDTAQFRKCGSRFDIIAADVPCSGEGMMRKDAEAAAQWSPGLVVQCAMRQREILANLWPALRPGGYLVYSTCTFNVDENEAMVQHLVNEYGAEPVAIDIPLEWGVEGAVVGNLPVCRFMPHKLRGEGLFMAVVRKPVIGDIGVRCRTPQKRKHFQSVKLPEAARHVADWLDPVYEAQLESDGDTVWAVPGGYDMDDSLRPRIPVAVLKGKSAMPTQELAMSHMMHRQAFEEWEVDRSTALTYLRHEALRLPEDAPRGVVLLTYGGIPLGFVKNLGNRANNLYPANWRILSALPQQSTFNRTITCLAGGFSGDGWEEQGDC